MDVTQVNPFDLLDTTTIFDTSKVRILDAVVSAMYHPPNHKEHEVAHKVLNDLTNLPMAWTYVGVIISESNNLNSKFFALTILEKCIASRWNCLGAADQNGIKQYVSELSLNLCRNEIVCNQDRYFLNKVNEILIKIVKKEWIENRWLTFISELCSSGRSSQAICENNLRLLNLLSEEVFAFGTDTTTSRKMKRLVETFTTEFQQVFDICIFVMQTHASGSRVSESLLLATLECIRNFLQWVPLEYIFETNILTFLFDFFWNHQTFKIITCKCLSEVANLKIPPSQKELFRAVLTNFWNLLLGKVERLPQDSLNYYSPLFVPQNMRVFWENFYTQITLCIVGFLKNNREIFEAGTSEQFTLCMQLLVSLTNPVHEQPFSVVLDFWLFLTEDIYRQENEGRTRNTTTCTPDGQTRLMEYSGIYGNVFAEVSKALISNMAKPEEVYIQYDEENGEIVRDYQTNTEEVALYNRMRKALIYLSRLNPLQMKNIIIAFLEQQEVITRMEDWNPIPLTRLCYSIGAITGTMSLQLEKSFLISVVRMLLSLCETKRLKPDKAIVASNIMYVVGQYPRFLSWYYKFLKTVVEKLFEFMLEKFPGIQKMACETFLKVSKRCAQSLAKPNLGNPCFLEESLKIIENQTAILEEKNLLHFYEAFGHLIEEAEGYMRPQYIEILMTVPNSVWRNLVVLLQKEHESIFFLEKSKALVQFLAINRALQRGVTTCFKNQMMFLYPNLLIFYTKYSGKIHSEVLCDKNRLWHADVKSFISVKRETLFFFMEFVSRGCHNREDTVNIHFILNHFLPQILQTVLVDFNMSAANVRECEVLSFVITLVEQLRDFLVPSLPLMFELLFKCCLDMIKSDFHSFPDHRMKFYEWLRACNLHCFEGLFNLPSPVLVDYVESLIWAFKHEQPALADLGLRITFEFLNNILNFKKHVLTDFCRLFYFRLLQEILGVLTDTLHRSGFKYQTLILLRLIHIMECQLVNDESSGLTKPNVIGELARLLCNSFETVNQKQAEIFVLDLFNFSAHVNDCGLFRTHVRDFLIQMKEFSGDNEELFEAERQEAIARAKQIEIEKEKKLLEIPEVYDVGDADKVED